MVWTANGAVPIVDIEEGQQVLAAPDDGLAESYASNEVGTKIIVGEASLVQLVLLHGDGRRAVFFGFFGIKCQLLTRTPKEDKNVPSDHSLCGWGLAFVLCGGLCF